MSRQFSDRQLYQARNHIPIRYVIETLLAIPSKTTGGIFRFRCPLCAGQHTAVKPETNLSRCFHCGKNFNTIDMCMMVKHISFVDSVKYLIKHLNQLPPPPENKPACPEGILPFKLNKSPLKGPVAIHEILSGLIGKGPLSTTEKDQPPASPTAIDIAELQCITHELSQVLQRLKSFCHLK